MLWSMRTFQIASIASPINQPALLGPLMRVVNRVWAMGVPLPGDGQPLALTVDTLRELLLNAGKYGIGRDLSQRFATVSLDVDPKEAACLLTDLAQAIEESPVPATEWPSMRALLGDEALQDILGISRQSIERYAAGKRMTPDVIADRLHWLAMVVSDLAGAYNALGMRRWFRRSRAVLDGRSPRDLLDKSWSSDAPPAQTIRALAASLTEMGAT